MKYLKLFENDITYPVEKLVEIVNLAEENSKNITEYVKKYASLIVSLTLYEVSQDISKYKEIIKKFEKNLEIIEKEQEKNSNVVDMYPIFPSERQAGTSELISKLEYKINRTLSNNSIELTDIKEFVGQLVYFVEHQNNNEIINSLLN